jgi:CubicO group peptidase (beta-lactamase class C family)
MDIGADRGAGLPRGVRGAADPAFGWAVRSFAAMFPHRRFGGGAMSVYLDGEPVVDVWTGWADRAGRQRWDADTGAMVFSATKGVASTVIHRLADRGLIDYDAPVAEYWRDFGQNGKADITVREMMSHRAGLATLNVRAGAEVLDHVRMEQQIAAAPHTAMRGKPAYHALTYGWLLSGLARAVTGAGMRELFRAEIAAPLGTDGLHLGRPPAGAATRAAQIIGPQKIPGLPGIDRLAPRIAAHPASAIFGAMYFPSMTRVIRGDTPMLDAEIPSANAVATARGLARMYAALCNGGVVGGRRLLSAEAARRLRGRRDLTPDRSLGLPMSFHLGYHGSPVPGVLPGYGHVGLGGSHGWAMPDAGIAIGFVHNRLLTPFLVSDQAGFLGTAQLIRRGAATARARGYRTVPDFGAPFPVPAKTA